MDLFLRFDPCFESHNRWLVAGGWRIPVTHRQALLRCLAALPASDQQLLRMLLRIARLHAFLLAPGAHHVPAAARAAAVRMIHRIHDLAADARAATFPPCLARLAPGQQLMLLVRSEE